MSKVIRTTGVQDETPVIFRKYADGEILALFPSRPSVHGGPTSCLGFTQPKGEITVDTSIMRTTTEATQDEYMNTFAAIVHAGIYPLKVVHRVKENLNQIRHKAAKKGSYVKLRRSPEERRAA